MNYKPGFIYIQIAAIGQTIAFSKKTGTVFCEDGTVYSPEEVQLFADADEAADLAPHTVKKVFGREEAGVERNSGKYTAEKDTEAERIGEAAIY
jgi:hypothetical protein